MKRDDLLRAVGQVGDDLVADAAPNTSRRKRVLPRWGAMAACLCLIAAGGLALSLRSGPAPAPGPADPSVRPSGGTASPGLPGVTMTPGPVATAGTEPGTEPGTVLATSDTYGSLAELLAYLSGHDDHSSRDSKEGGGAGDAVRDPAGYTAVVKDGYAYHLAREEGGTVLRVSRLEGRAELLDSIPVEAELLFLWGDRLAAVGHSAPPIAIDDPGAVQAALFDLSDPARPVPERKFSLPGGLAACWQDGNSLYVAAEDGVCACGWSRLSDPADYLPRLEQDGQEVPWGEDEVSILGEPTQIHYAAAVRIDLSTGTAAGKRAFYGDVQGICHGEGWLALVTGGYTGEQLLPPQVYAFSEEFAFDGKLDAAALLGLSPARRQADGSLPDGSYPRVVSVSRTGDVLRAVGYVTRRESGENSNSLLAAAADLSSGESSAALLPVERFFRIGDLQWEEDRALLWVTAIDSGLNKADGLYLARFDGAQAEAVTDSGLTCDSVDGVDKMYSYGSPLGWLETAIPLGDGRYLRHNGTPDGLDLYDLSGEGPALLRRSAARLEDGGRFEFQWEVYDPNTVGVLTVWPNENGEYRGVSFAWDVYDVVGDSLALRSRTPVPGKTLTLLEHGGQRWLAAGDGSLIRVD